MSDNITFRKGQSKERTDFTPVSDATSAEGDLSRKLEGSDQSLNLTGLFEGYETDDGNTASFDDESDDGDTWTKMMTKANTLVCFTPNQHLNLHKQQVACAGKRRWVGVGHTGKVCWVVHRKRSVGECSNVVSLDLLVLLLHRKNDILLIIFQGCQLLL